MMKKATLKKAVRYTVDLTKIDGDGTFQCPKCGTVISPDDESEDTYQIVDTRVKGDELAELVAAHPLQINPALPLRFQGDTWRVIGEAEAMVGSPEKAAAAYDQAIEVYDQLGSRLDLGRLLIYRGQLRQSQGEAAAARADWLRARSIFEACGAVRDAAKTQRLLDTE